MTPESLLIGGFFAMLPHMLLMLRDLTTTEALPVAPQRLRHGHQPTGPRIKPPPPPHPAGSSVSTRRPSTPRPMHPPPPMPRPREPTSIKG